MCWFMDRTILDGSGIATVSRPAVRFSCGTPAPCAERLRNLLIRISTSLYCNRWGKNSRISSAGAPLSYGSSPGSLSALPNSVPKLFFAPRRKKTRRSLSCEKNRRSAHGIPPRPAGAAELVPLRSQSSCCFRDTRPAAAGLPAAGAIIGFYHTPFLFKMQSLFFLIA